MTILYESPLYGRKMFEREVELPPITPFPQKKKTPSAWVTWKDTSLVLTNQGTPLELHITWDDYHLNVVD